MTIRTHLLCREPHNRLCLLEDCVENAPEGTYEDAKLLRGIIGNMADDFMARLQEMGLDTPNCDQIREFEAVAYNYVTEANPLAFASAEGFGEAMSGPARERVIAAAERDRDFLTERGRNIGLWEETVDEALLDLAQQRAQTQ